MSKVRRELIPYRSIRYPIATEQISNFKQEGVVVTGLKYTTDRRSGQAFIAVDEKGTEAAAATAVVMEAAMAPSQQKVHLIIDHPFIFVIRDLKSGQILFIGRVLSPAQ